MQMSGDDWVCYDRSCSGNRKAFVSRSETLTRSATP